MNLFDAMRKAKSLLIETDAPPPTPSTAPDGEPPSVDELLSVLDGQPASARTVDDVVRSSDGPNLQDISAKADSQTALVVPLRADGSVDFPTLYASLGVPASPFGAEQMLEVLATLPPELPLETRRATVKVTLGALSRAAGGANAGVRRRTRLWPMRRAKSPPCTPAWRKPSGS